MEACREAAKVMDGKELEVVTLGELVGDGEGVRDGGGGEGERKGGSGRGAGMEGLRV